MQDSVNLIAKNVILFQIKVFGRNIKETTLARYFIKGTVRLSFTQLNVIFNSVKISALAENSA